MHEPPRSLSADTVRLAALAIALDVILERFVFDPIECDKLERQRRILEGPADGWFLPLCSEQNTNGAAL